jgi:hypothetical protein
MSIGVFMSPRQQKENWDFSIKIVSLHFSKETECGEEEKDLNLAKLTTGESTIENWWCHCRVHGLTMLFNFGGLLC